MNTFTRQKTTEMLKQRKAFKKISRIDYVRESGCKLLVYNINSCIVRAEHALQRIR